MPDGGVLTALPLAINVAADGQRWQAYTLARGGPQFRIPGGYFLGPGGDGRQGPHRRGPPAAPTGCSLQRRPARRRPPIDDCDRAAGPDRLRLLGRQRGVPARPDQRADGWPLAYDAVKQTATELLGPPERVDDVLAVADPPRHRPGRLRGRGARLDRRDSGPPSSRRPCCAPAWSTTARPGTSSAACTTPWWPASSPTPILLLEHPSVYTAGKRTEPPDRPIDGTPVVDVDRGGKITWHGPGQLVGYPIVRLPDPIDVVAYVRRTEQLLIDVCAEFGRGRRPGRRPQRRLGARRRPRARTARSPRSASGSPAASPSTASPSTATATWRSTTGSCRAASATPASPRSAPSWAGR